MVTIYILKCEDDKYYVGKIASNVWKRIKQHFDGKGAKWTKRYQPIDIVDVRRGLTDRDESKITIDFMKAHGIHNVRGGAYTKIRLDRNQVEHLEYRLGITDKKPENRMFDKPHAGLWPVDYTPNPRRRNRKTAEKIRKHGRCRGSTKSGRRCSSPCEKGESTCSTHTGQRE